MAHTLKDMKEKLAELKTEGEKVGLKINANKTKELRVNCLKQEELTIGETVIDRVDEFQYLGSVITKNGGTDEDIKQRLKKANIAFMQLREIWKSQQLRRQTKLRIFETYSYSLALPFVQLQCWVPLYEVFPSLPILRHSFHIFQRFPSLSTKVFNDIYI